ncbi:MAG: hypothetical protein V1821_03600, partial [bacterium]
GIEIDADLKYVNSIAYIRPDGVPTLLVKFAAAYRSGEVKLEVGTFDGYLWVNAEEVKNCDCILGVPEEILKTIKLFQA